MSITSTLTKWYADRRRRAALRAMCEFDERLLKDVGVRRADLFVELRR